MKTDLYTKFILTVIAIALVGILVRDIDFVGKAQASKLPEPTEVRDTKSSDVVDVNIVKVNGYSVGSGVTPIPVTVK